MKVCISEKEYILEVLIDEEDKLFGDIYYKLDDDMKFLFSKYVAVMNEISNIKVSLVA